MTNGKAENEIEKEVEQRMREIEMLAREARERGLSFSAPDREQITKKIRRETSKSPYIYAQSWTSGTSPGTSAYYSVYVSNPDPGGYYPVFASIFFGAGANFLDDGDLAEALADGNFNSDGRWPYMSSPPFSLASGATANQQFAYAVPAVPLTTYIGNCVIWGGQYHDRGQYFDRGLFYITLS